METQLVAIAKLKGINCDELRGNILVSHREAREHSFPALF
jgi:hypothetical protein